MVTGAMVTENNWNNDDFEMKRRLKWIVQWTLITIFAKVKYFFKNLKLSLNLYVNTLNVLPIKCYF